MKRGQAGGQAVKAKYGPEHFSKLGRRGYKAMVQKWFGGDYQAANEWLRRKGAFEIDKDTSYAKPTVFSDPGPHPAHLAMSHWLIILEEEMEQPTWRE